MTKTQIKLEAIKCRYCGHEFDPSVVEEGIKQCKEKILNRKTTKSTPLIKIEVPENSYVCGECDFVIPKEEFKESNLFCPECGSLLEET